MALPIIETHNLGKKYKIKRSDIVGPNAGQNDIVSTKAKGRETIWALREVDLKLYPGKIVGVLGDNGSGKSTLFKLISEITDPSEGKIILRGKISTLLEVGAGFHHELTGQENIYLYGAIMGMIQKEIDNCFDDIVSFAGVQKFLNVPMKRYSSGMYARLAFAVASHLKSDILIVDEVLAVNDSTFRKKSLKRMLTLAEQGCAILIASHNIKMLKSICDSAIILKKGRLIGSGTMDEMISIYNPPKPKPKVAAAKTV